jgi:hypothetical protein
MRVGTIYSSVVLDRDSRVYSGSEDPVTGDVVLEFKAWDREKGETSVEELFGSLKINLIFEGDIKTEIDEDYLNRASHPEYRDNRELFQQTTLIYDGQFRTRASEKKYIPFKLFFPKRAQPTVQQRRNGLQEDDWDSLPPALHAEFSGAHGGGKGSVEYRIKAELRLPGIDVDVATRGILPSLQYRPSNTQDSSSIATATFEQAFTVSDESLIPESERPQGFRAKAKAFLKEVEPPTYAFDIIWIDVPETERPSQSLNFRVAIRTNHERTTATVKPDVLLQECKVTIIGFCGVRVWPTLESAKESGEMRDLEDAAVVFGTIYPDGAFSKGGDYTKTITTQPLPYLPCSFAMERMSRYYKARINMSLQVGSRRINAMREFPITVFPPLQQSRSDAVSGA